MSDGTTGERERLPRGVKRDSDYAVLNTGQLIPDVESPKQAMATKKRPPVCVWCHEPGDVVPCVNCDSPFHRVCAMKRDPSATALCAKCLPRGPRYRLPNATSLDDAVRLLREATNIVVLVGAGISVSCGIPDFRSENGIYTIIQKMGLNLPEPEALFDIDFFRSDPSPFFHFAMDFFNGTYTPSRTHRFLRELHDAKKLLRVYSQNIDGLEADAGVPNVVACHGSLATASCMLCGKNAPTSTLRLSEVVAANAIPRCDCGGVMKPDITFFGQALAPSIRESLAMDAPKVDLLIVIGTSLQVSPVSDIPAYLPRDVPQLLINMESVIARGTDGFDVELLGACDTVVEYLHHAMATTNDEAATVAGSPHHHEPNVYCFGTDACYWSDDEDDDEKGPLVDDYFQCDGCAEEVDCEEAPRYSCTTCFDYDLCEACHASDAVKASHYDGQHEFALH
ncbi:NAD-dependent deacetylase sirtuin 1 [Saprolegnia diclina VS20]|uniref:NAD-dependent deacetylase sirtuin 1 n=2 Tax=Saprolegnia diclina (strain VS20) TaxID=1156394 RepID=T0QIB5_SAPDV|nr:NAD-dependent deacetylase sirtuin 1 [Saprolegnia diclina VS20]EQC33450.1 NAD-dependent deacetylase sirtuin 1 [Saprolegnia diclina VS20]|eukprot:XP_008613090.1 NAD-dependent deacetylase sirtuin 1 [Saprolegnia diclina VS20]